jgi:hypothetical protein
MSVMAESVARLIDSRIEQGLPARCSNPTALAIIADALNEKSDRPPRPRPVAREASEGDLNTVAAPITA